MRKTNLQTSGVGLLKYTRQFQKIMYNNNNFSMRQKTTLGV